jgi:parallel beta-helix repeat protein
MVENMVRVKARNLSRLAMVALLWGAALFCPPSHAATINVTANAPDALNGSDGICSLREAITNINNAGIGVTYGDCVATGFYGIDDTINIPAGTYTIAIPGAGEDSNATGDYDIQQSVAIIGAGAATTIINGGALDRVFDIDTTMVGSWIISISGVTISGGQTNVQGAAIRQNSSALNIANCVISGNTASSNHGGGIYQSSGSLTITNSTISGNAATTGGAGGIITGGSLTIVNSTISGNTAGLSGGGIYNFGSLTVTNSTISGNTAGLSGGGIYNFGSSAVTNSTISGNTATLSGGGIYNAGGTATFTNTIVNQSLASKGGCLGAIISGGHNLDILNTCAFTGTGDLINTDPLLGPLADNGGPTQTMILSTASPAIDAGDLIVCAQNGAGKAGGVDQRGVMRPQGSGCDIGALELVKYTLTYIPGANGSITGITPQTALPNTSGTAVTAVPAAGYRFVNWSDTSTANPRTDANLTGDITVIAYFASIAGFSVTPSAGANGTITPSGLQTVSSGATTTFTLIPNPGFDISVGGTCGGTLVGTTYTTNAITAACTVVATFAPNASYTVSATVGAGGTVTPAIQLASGGSTASFTVTPNTGYSANSTIGGTCAAGSLVGTTYTTGVVTKACSVSFSFSLKSGNFNVSAVGGNGGTVTPATQGIASGATASFAVTANGGYTTNSAVGGTCPAGSWNGATYTTGVATAECYVSFGFTILTGNYTVSATAGVGGTLTPAIQGVLVNATAAIMVTPSQGYTTNPTVGGTCAKGSWNGAKYTTGAVPAACSASFTFDPNPNAPTVTTGGASGISLAGGAVITGFINPGALATTVSFEYAATALPYGVPTPIATPLTGFTTQTVSLPLTGLTCGTTYHYRVTATNSLGTGVGADATFVACLSKTFADFNGDGVADILWRNTSTGANALWFMNGITIISQNALATISSSSWNVAGVGDFDGDGKSDILWRNASTGQNSVWLMSTATIISRNPIATIPPGWTAVGVGDFDGDGKSDILWRNMSTGENSIWLMNGTTIISQNPLKTVPPAWTMAGVADFNRDGKSDILWRNASTGANSIWLMNGITKIGGGVITAVPGSAWIVAGLADFNADGMADILWRNTSTGQNSIWLMNGATITSRNQFATIPPGWTAAEIADFNGDGMADILWRNTSTGQNSIWLMNGVKKTGGGPSGSAGTAWKVRSKR